MKDNVPSYADIENIKKEVDESLSLLKKIIGQSLMLQESRLRKQQHQL